MIQYYSQLQAKEFSKTFSLMTKYNASSSSVYNNLLTNITGKRVPDPNGNVFNIRERLLNVLESDDTDLITDMHNYNLCGVGSKPDEFSPMMINLL